jgi:hypothetical protein
MSLAATSSNPAWRLGVLGLELGQLVAGRLPILTGSDFVLGHRPPPGRFVSGV